MAMPLSNVEDITLGKDRGAGPHEVSFGHAEFEVGFRQFGMCFWSSKKLVGWGQLGLQTRHRGDNCSYSHGQDDLGWENSRRRRGPKPRPGGVSLKREDLIRDVGKNVSRRERSAVLNVPKKSSTRKPDLKMSFAFGDMKSLVTVVRAVL